MLADVLPTATREHRRSNRYLLKELVRVSWTDGEGRFHHVDTACLDASATGIRVRLPRRVDNNCYINVRSEKLGLNSSARVRNVSPKGLDFVVVLEFNGGWRWDRLRTLVTEGQRT